MKMKRIMKSTRGEGYIDLAVAVLVLVFALVIAISLWSAITLKQDMRYMCEELIATATSTGKVGEEVEQRFAELCEETGITPTVTWNTTYYNATGKQVQLGEIITCALTHEITLQGFGTFTLPFSVTSTQYEQYSASQHKRYSYCADCNSTIGSVSYEGHTFTNSTSNGQVVSTCKLCGYTKTMAQTYTVSYNANGGSNAPSSQTKVHGVTLTLSSTVPYRFNYEFLGWSASSSATTATYTAGGNYTGNVSVTLFAVWKYKPATYTVSYDANGGTGAPGRQTKTYGVTLTLTTIQPTRRNYLFLGWSKDRNATSASYTAGGSYTDNADVTLYAVWRYDPETYTVRYDANGGTGAPASQTKTYGVPLTLSAVKPTRAGYEFLGWATSKNATASEYEVEAESKEEAEAKAEEKIAEGNVCWGDFEITDSTAEEVRKEKVRDGGDR